MSLYPDTRNPMPEAWRSHINGPLVGTDEPSSIGPWGTTLSIILAFVIGLILFA